MKTISTLNFSNMDSAFLETINACLDSIYKLSIAEQDLKKRNEGLEKDGIPRADWKNHNERERLAKSQAKSRAETLCLMTISRYIDTADFVGGDIFTFSMEGFLSNIGVLEGCADDLKKSAVKKISAFRSEVVNRKRTTVTRRKNGENKLTYSETKEVKNTAIELILALCDGFASTGALEYSKGHLVKVDFTDKLDNKVTN